MTHSTVIVLILSTLVATPALADSQPLAPYADYVTYVTTFRARTTGDRALAIATHDPAGTRCFASASRRTDRELCQRYLQEKALIDAMPAIAIAARAKLFLDGNPDEPSRAAMLPIGQACVEAADRVAETGIAPLRKVGPYTIGLLKSKLCNALLVATEERGDERVSATAH